MVMRIFTLAALVVVSASGYISASAQGTQPQIPTLQVCNNTKAFGRGIVKIDSRADSTHSGKFTIFIPQCDAQNQYCWPRGHEARSLVGCRAQSRRLV